MILSHILFTLLSSFSHSFMINTPPVGSFNTLVLSIYIIQDLCILCIYVSEVRKEESANIYLQRTVSLVVQLIF